MAPLFRLLALCLLLNLSLPAVSAEQVSKDDLDAHKELLQLKIDSGKESVQKDIEALGKRLEAVDKRIDDQVNRFSDLGFFAGVLATLITVVLAGLGMLGYVSVTSRARETSEAIAGKTAEKWFANNQQDLRAQITQIQSTSQQAQTEIEVLQQAAQSHHQEMAELRTQMQAAKGELEELRNLTDQGKQTARDCQSMAEAEMAAMQKNIDIRAASKSEQATDQPASTSTGLERLVAALEKAIHSEKEFSYWNALAFKAYAKNDLKGAAEHWLRAATIENAIPALAAQALNNAGVVHGQLGQLEEEIKTYDQVIALYIDDPSPQIPQQVASAMVNKGVAQVQQGQPEEAIKTYDQVIARYNHDPSPETRHQVARAMGAKVASQGRLGQPKEAIKTCDQLIALYSHDPSPEIREHVARAMVSKGAFQGQLGQPKEAIKTSKETIATYSGDPHPKTREQVALAMVNMGVAQGRLGQPKEKIKTSDILISLYSDDSHPGTREQVARAMVNKGDTQGQMGQREEAIKTYEEVIVRNSDDPYPKIREQVARAINGKAFILLLDAKAQLATNPTALVQTTLNEAQALLGLVLEGKPNWDTALGNLAYVQWLLQQPAAAESSFRQALLSKEDGNEALYRTTLDDIAQHPIPADQGFRELVDRLWAEYQNQASGPATG